MHLFENTRIIPCALFIKRTKAIDSIILTGFLKRKKWRTQLFYFHAHINEYGVLCVLTSFHFGRINQQ